MIQAQSLTDILDWVCDEMERTDPVHRMPEDAAERLSTALTDVMQDRRDMMVGRMLRGLARRRLTVPTGARVLQTLLVHHRGMVELLHHCLTSCLDTFGPLVETPQEGGDR